MTQPTAGPWWQQLRSPADRPLPGSVAERMRWYSTRTRSQRLANSVLEGSAVVLAAAIPAAAALGAPVAAMAVLGALVAVLTGLRQLLRPAENWIRTSGALVTLQREAVLWSAGAEPYTGPDADKRLIERAEDVVTQETASWAALRAPAERPDPVLPAPPRLP